MDYYALLQCLREWLSILLDLLKLRFTSGLKKDLEIIALRSQLALFYNEIEAGKRPKPKTTPAFRQLWVLLSKYYDDWKTLLIIFKPETIIRWHRTAFSFYWFKKSKRKGRPQISQEVIRLIKEIHTDNPLLSPEKIHEQLLLKNIINAPSPNTIAKYLPSIRKPPSGGFYLSGFPTVSGVIGNNV